MNAPPPPTPRHDGWTVDRQVRFLAELERTRCVARAAAAAGMSREGAYRFRRRPAEARFAALWDRILAAPRPRSGPGHEAHTRGHEGHAGPAPQSAASSGKGHGGHGKSQPRTQVTRVKQAASAANSAQLAGQGPLHPDGPSPRPFAAASIATPPPPSR